MDFENYVKNSFDKLIFSYPNLTLHENEGAIIINNNLNEKEILLENQLNLNIESQNLINQSNHNEGYFCNDECYNKFFEFIRNGANSLDLPQIEKTSKNIEELRVLLANVYNNGYNQGYYDKSNSSNM